MITPTKRYDKKNFVSILSSEYDLLGSTFIESILRDATFRTYTIPETQAYRIDLISRSIYGTTDLTWLVMTLNSIVYIEELVKFRVLKVVSLRDIESSYFKWKQKG